MKSKVFLIISLLFATPVLYTGCPTAPSSRVIEVQTLKAVGESAQAALILSINLYQDSVITAAQARQVADFYDFKFQPAYKVAVSAVSMNLNNVASPDLISLVQQLSKLVAQLQYSSK